MRTSQLTTALLILIVSLWESSAYSKQRKLPPVDTIDHSRLLKIVREDSGNVHLVNVWATWCDPCRKEIPTLLNLRKQFRNQGFTLIFVSADDLEITGSKVRPMLKNFGVDFLTYIMHDTTDEAFIAGMSPDWKGALPTSFLYDKQGKFVDMIVGERTYQQFSKAIVKLLKE